MGGWHHDNANWKDKLCAMCASAFKPASGVHKYCSYKCKRAAHSKGSENTNTQYKYISGNWDRYFNRLVAQRSRKGVITRADCMALLQRQNYKCALSGVALTCTLERGTKYPTNASLDRIDPKGLYTPDNVQLVCVILNCFRVDTELGEFVEWCKKVAEHAAKRQI